MAMEQEQPKIDPSLARHFRSGRGRRSLIDLATAACVHPFDPRLAASAWDAHRSEWEAEFGVAQGCLSVPWMSNGADSGQADNAHATFDISHPLVAACRWGSAESIAWLCSLPGASPVVEFVDACLFWSFSRAACSGIQGAFEPLWAKACDLGWGGAELGECLSAWMMGAQQAQSGSAAALLSSSAGARDWLLAIDPEWSAPLSTSSVFGTALSAAICAGEDLLEGNSEAVKALLDFLPASRWRHESLIPGSELWNEIWRADGEPNLPGGFVEDALSIGNPVAVDLLAEAGFPLPTPQEALRAGGGPSSRDEGVRLAFDRALRHWSAAERSQIDGACAEAKPGGGPVAL